LDEIFFKTLFLVKTYELISQYSCKSFIFIYNVFLMMFVSSLTTFFQKVVFLANAGCFIFALYVDFASKINF